MIETTAIIDIIEIGSQFNYLNYFKNTFGGPET